MQKEDNCDTSVNKAKTEPEEHSGIIRSHGNGCLALMGTHIGLSPLPSLIASLTQVTCWGALHEPDGEFRDAERGAARSGRRHCSPSPPPPPCMLVPGNNVIIRPEPSNVSCSSIGPSYLLPQKQGGISTFQTLPEFLL